MKQLSANFDFLAKDDPQLVRLGGVISRMTQSTSLIKLRQFGELLAQQTAARSGLLNSPDEQQVDLLRRLKFERVVPPGVGDLLHQLRVAGKRCAALRPPLPFRWRRRTTDTIRAAVAARDGLREELKNERDSVAHERSAYQELVAVPELPSCR